MPASYGMLGKRHTEEAKLKISEALKGKKRSPFSDKHRKKISEIAKKRIGSKNPNWKGGITTYARKLWWSTKHRARKKGAEGSHTQGEWELLKRQYGYTCPACGREEPETKLTEDHIIPLSKGGSDYIENIQPLCKSCNCKKHTKIVRYDHP